MGMVIIVLQYQLYYSLFNLEYWTRRALLIPNTFEDDTATDLLYFQLQIKKSFRYYLNKMEHCGAEVVNGLKSE